jgi:type VI secretion system secreted protein Hcp
VIQKEISMKTNQMKSTFGKFFGVFCLAAVLAALPAHAALNMFLDLGSGIPGESTDPAHTNQVDVLAWSWGMSNPGTVGAGGPSGGKVNIQDLSLTKYVDKSSPLLMLNCAKGSHIATATLYVLKAGATKNNQYIKIIMTDVLVTSVSTGGSGGEDKLTENISLNFAKVEFDYSSDGTDATTGKFTWDIADNTP